MDKDQQKPDLRESAAAPIALGAVEPAPVRYVLISGLALAAIACVLMFVAP